MVRGLTNTKYSQVLHVINLTVCHIQTFQHVFLYFDASKYGPLEVDDLLRENARVIHGVDIIATETMMKDSYCKSKWHRRRAPIR